VLLDELADGFEAAASLSSSIKTTLYGAPANSAP
jgi:hypothetical protein